MKLSGIALLLVASSPVSAQGIRYEPGTARYEQNIVIGSAQNLGNLGLPPEIRSRLILSTAITKVGASTDSLLLVVTVDSSSTTGAEALTRGQQVAPVGTRAERKMTPAGKSAPTPNRPADAIITGIFPVLANNARLGSAWEDTVAVDLLGVSSALQGVSGQMARAFLVSRDTTYDGEPAWKIEIGSKTTVSMSASRNSLPITVDGGGDGQGVIFVSKKGVLLHSSETQSLTLNLRLAGGGGGAGAAFPIETNTTRSVRRIK